MPPAAVFFAVIGGLALLIAAPRAAVEFGCAGLVAYIQFVASPLIVSAALYIWCFPTSINGKLSWAPSRPALAVIGWILLAVTSVLLAIAAVFGMGWMMRRH